MAGHETTSTTISWVLLELARNPKIQSRLRDEIRKTEATAYARGDSQLTIQDLEAMPYLNAVIKVSVFLGMHRLDSLHPFTGGVAGPPDNGPLF